MIAGRSENAVLSELGREQAARMAERVGQLPVRAIYSSPVVRARQTAAALAKRVGLDVQVSEALSEVDFGQWAGCELAELKPLERWKCWNAFGTVSDLSLAVSAR